MFCMLFQFFLVVTKLDVKTYLKKKWEKYFRISTHFNAPITEHISISKTLKLHLTRSACVKKKVWRKDEKRTRRKKNDKENNRSKTPGRLRAMISWNSHSSYGANFLSFFLFLSFWLSQSGTLQQQQQRQWLSKQSVGGGWVRVRRHYLTTGVERISCGKRDAKLARFIREGYMPEWSAHYHALKPRKKKTEGKKREEGKKIPAQTREQWLRL